MDVIIIRSKIWSWNDNQWNESNISPNRLMLYHVIVCIIKCNFRNENNNCGKEDGNVISHYNCFKFHCI